MTKHRASLINDYVRPVYSAPFQVGPITKKLAAAKIDRLTNEKVIEAANTKWTTPTLFAPKK